MIGRNAGLLGPVHDMQFASIALMSSRSALVA
jgi:hypothetical protein